MSQTVLVPLPDRRPDRFRRFLGTGLVLALLPIGPAAAQTRPGPPPQRPLPPADVPGVSLERAVLGIGRLDGAELERMVRALSSARFAGRLTGTPGYDRAARWAAEVLRSAGTVPGGSDGSWFQPFTVETCEVTGPMELRIVRSGWVEAPYLFGVDYVARGFTGSGRVEEAEVVFVGFGLQDRALGRDDYAGADLKGKVALMFMGAPTAEWGDKSRPRFKATLARRLGARAILFIDDPGSGASSPIASVYHGGEGTHQTDLPMLSIRDRVADDLLKGSGQSAASLRQAEGAGQAPAPFLAPARVTLEAHAAYTPQAQTWNVVGWVEGSDPAVADEWVVVGGHLDHVGSQAGVIFPGAKDNASGSVMVLALARAMAAAPVRPRRSVCFVLFAGEEMFLLGSEYFATHPPRPIEKCTGMINLDMPGGGNTLRINGGASTPAFQQMAVEADRLFGGFALDEQRSTPAVEGASDHSAFVRRSVPTLYIAAGGGPGRAHTPDDVADTIDFQAYARATTVVYLILFQIADRP
jgi:hypothetical protein